MTNSYLGIVTPRGIETLVIETEHAAPFLFRRAQRHADGEIICFWAVLDHRMARRLIYHIECGRFQEAFCQFCAHAQHLGTLTPPITEDDLLQALP